MKKFLSASPTTISEQLDISQLPGGGSVEIYLNGDLKTTAKIDATSGSFLVNVPLVEGDNQVVMVTVNAIGIKGAPSPAHLFALDTQPPLIESLQPADGVVLLQAREIRAIVKDSTIVSSTVSGIDAGSIKLMLNGVEVTGYGYDAVSGQLSHTLVAPLAVDVQHTVSLEAADQLGNLSKVESTFRLESELEDETAPVITGLWPKAGEIINGRHLQDPDFTLRGAAYDVESGLAEVLIRLDGEEVSSGKFLVRMQDGLETEAARDIGDIAYVPQNLTDGEPLLTIYARDKSGNQQTANSSFLVDTKTERPVFDVVSSVVNQRVITLSGQAEAGSKVSLYVNGKPVGVVMADEGGRFSQDGVGLIEGENQFSGGATDLAGNISSKSAVRNLLLDVRSPLIGNPVPAPSSRVKSRLVEMAASLSDNPGGSGIDRSSIRFVLDGNRELSEFVYNSESGQLSYVPASNSAELVSLKEGSHFFRVQASDHAGNQTVYNSGQFVVDYTAPLIEEVLPGEGEVLSSAAVELTALIKADDIGQVSMELLNTDLSGNKLAVSQEYDAISGKLTVKPEVALSNGKYKAVVKAVDLAGNESIREVNFSMNIGGDDTTAPLIKPQFPLPGQEISSTSFMAIKFQVLDSDSGVNFLDMSVEINGVVYQDLFKPGSGNRFSRRTGEVILYGRLQLELGALEDPLDLRALEDSLDLGVLEDPLELGTLERPLDLAVGLNSLDITVSDDFGNFSTFDFSFGVSLTAPIAPFFGFQEKATQFADIGISNVTVIEGQITAGEEFTVNFDAESGVEVALLDFSQIDDALPSMGEKGLDDRPDWAVLEGEFGGDLGVGFGGDLGRGFGGDFSSSHILSQIQPEQLWQAVSKITEAGPGIDPFKLIKLDLQLVSPMPYDVPFGSSRYQATVSVTANTKVLDGRKTVRLIALKTTENQEIVFDLQETSMTFSNPSYSWRGNRLQGDASPVEQARAVVIIQSGDNLHTNSPQIPISGVIPKYDPSKKLEVEIFANDNSMGVVPVKKDGSFSLQPVLLRPGLNKVTSFTRSASQLQSSVSKPQRVFFDQVKPEVEFIDLPSHVSQSPAKIQIGYQDDSGGIASSVTLFVNGQPQAVSTETVVTTVSVKLKVGDNLLVVSSVDLAGNISQPIQRRLVLDDKAPETVPSNLSATLSFSGREVTLNWSADVNADSYNLYRSEGPIDQVDAKQRLAENLPVTMYRDADINVGSTYYYALTSVSPAGLESKRLSVNLNLTVLLASLGGTAVLSDGSRLTAAVGSVTVDPTLYTSISIENPAELDLPDLAGSIEGTARRFVAMTQNGALFTSDFLSPVDIAIPYPLSEIPESLKVFMLEDGVWKIVEDVKVNTDSGTLNLVSNRFGTYRLMRPESKPWDINMDNMVNIFDLVLVGMNFMKSGADVVGDTNLDQTIDLYDLVTVTKHFGEIYGKVTVAAPMALMGQSGGRVSMHARHSSNHSGGRQSQHLELEIKADMPDSIAGYQLELIYNPRLLAVVGFERGNILGKGSSGLDPRMMPGRIANIALAQVGDSAGSGVGHSTLAQVGFRLKGDLDLALSSIGIRNLLLANRQLQPMPVEIDPSVVIDQELVAVSGFSLGQNYPNPFNPETWIPYKLASSEKVGVQIYDASGHLMRRIDMGLRSAGDYTLRGKSAYWDGRNAFGEQVASGGYYYTIDAGDFSSANKMLLLK